MGLSPEEKEQLKALQRKSQEPDEPAIGKSATYIVDLKDKASVAMAKTLGLLPRDEEEESEEGEGESADEGPTRRSYFGS